MTSRKMRAWRAAIVKKAERTARAAEKIIGISSQMMPVKLPPIESAVKAVAPIVPMPSSLATIPAKVETRTASLIEPLEIAMSWIYIVCYI